MRAYEFQPIDDEYCDPIDLHWEAYEELSETNPELFENAADYPVLKSEFQEFVCQEPVVGQYFKYISVWAMPVANFMDIKLFEYSRELIDIAIDKNTGKTIYRFDIDGVSKQFPSAGNKEAGSMYTHIFLFDESSETEFLSWLNLKYSGDKWQLNYKFLDVKVPLKQFNNP